MKTYTRLWNDFISKENFELAYKKAILGKSQQRQVQAFKLNWKENLEKIRQSVINGEFTTSKYHARTIYEPKERVIYSLPFAPDRIVQHAIMNIMSPILQKKFYYQSYSCIPNKGQHKASLRCNEYVRRNKYCLKCDIRKFYPSINQKILSELYHKFIKDEKFMNLLDDIIFSFEGETNVPIGNLTSQWSGNLYLTELDSFIKHELKIKDYLRYCDDFMLFNNDKAYLHECRKRIEVFLADRLKLTYSKDFLLNTKQGIDFCGYRHFGKYTLTRKSTALRMKRRFKKLPFDYYSGKISFEELTSSVASTWGWIKHSKYKLLLKSLKSIFWNSMRKARKNFKNPLTTL